MNHVASKWQLHRAKYFLFMCKQSAVRTDDDDTYAPSLCCGGEETAQMDFELLICVHKKKNNLNENIHVRNFKIVNIVLY